MKHRFNSKQKAILSVDVPEEQNKPQPIRRGLIPPLQPVEYLPRRSSGIYLRFWDLGRLANGDENTPGVVPTLTFDTTSPVDFATPVTYPAFDWDDYRQTFFDIEADVNNWSTAFYQIPFAEAYKYGIDYLDGTYPTTYYVYPVAQEADRNPVYNYGASNLGTIYQWTENGLKVPAADRINLQLANAFFPIYTDNIYNKVTSTYNPSATAVDFNLDASCDIFMVPSIHLWFASAYKQYAAFPTTNYYLFNYLNYIYKAWDRSAFLTAPAWWLTRYSTQPLATPNTISNSTPPTTFGTNFKDYYKTMADARLYSGTDDRILNTVTAGYIAPSNYTNTGSTGTSQGSPYLQTIRQTPSTNTLMAVIKKGSSFYYVWGTASTFTPGLPVTVYTD